MTDPTDMLSTFLAMHGPAGLTRKTAALQAAERVGLGSWLTPQTATEAGRPTTHLHEITMFGISASGECADQAVANWFQVAGRLAAGQVAA